MYCVIGEKVLRCEVKKKEETSCLCKVGSAKKEQVISNNRLFETEKAASDFIKKRKVNQNNERNIITSAVETCKALYEKLYEETGIEVRTIDRQWTVTSAEKHIAKLKKTLTDKPETHDKNVSKSFSFTPKSNREKKKFGERSSAGKGISAGKNSYGKDNKNSKRSNIKSNRAK